MTALQVVLEVDHAPTCRAASWQAGGSAGDWVVSTWVLRDTSEQWLAVSCNDALCHAAGLISQASILDHARAGLAKATPERPFTPDAVEERDRQRAERRGDVVVQDVSDEPESVLA